MNNRNMEIIIVRIIHVQSDDEQWKHRNHGHLNYSLTGLRWTVIACESLSSQLFIYRLKDEQCWDRSRSLLNNSLTSWIWIVIASKRSLSESSTYSLKMSNKNIKMTIIWIIHLQTNDEQWKLRNYGYFYHPLTV